MQKEDYMKKTDMSMLSLGGALFGIQRLDTKK